MEIELNRQLAQVSFAPVAHNKMDNKEVVWGMKHSPGLVVDRLLVLEGGAAALEGGAAALAAE
jgi:hypothetical protein